MDQIWNLHSSGWLGKIQERIFLFNLCSVLVKMFSLHFTNQKIKTKPVCTGGVGKENAMNTHFYKPQKPRWMLCASPWVVFGLLCWPIKAGIFQEKCVKHRFKRALQYSAKWNPHFKKKRSLRSFWHSKEKNKVWACLLSSLNKKNSFLGLLSEQVLKHKTNIFSHVTLIW